MEPRTCALSHNLCPFHYLSSVPVSSIRPGDIAHWHRCLPDKCRVLHLIPGSNLQDGLRASCHAALWEYLRNRQWVTGHYSVSPSYETLRTADTKSEWWLSGRGEGVPHGCRASFGDMKNGLELDRGGDCTALIVPTATELFTSTWSMVKCVLREFHLLFVCFYKSLAGSPFYCVQARNPGPGWKP